MWKYQRTGKRLQVDIEPFTQVPTWALAKLESDAVRLATFLGGALKLDIAAPAAGKS